MSRLFPPDGQALAESLASNKRLKGLWLENNNIGDCGAEALGPAGLGGGDLQMGWAGGVWVKQERRLKCRCCIVYSDFKRGNEVGVQIERDQVGAVGG